MAIKWPLVRRQTHLEYYHANAHLYIDDIKELERLRADAEERGDLKALDEYQLHLEGARKVLNFIYEELGVESV